MRASKLYFLFLLEEWGSRVLKKDVGRKETRGRVD